MAKRIKLNIEEPTRINRPSWPITQGVPFPDKELERGTSVRIVDGDGNPLPTQSTCLTTWDKDMRYVKWLLLDFQANIKGGSTSQFFLEYGPDIKLVEPDHPVTTERKGENVFISTGELKLKLCESSPDFFSSAKVKTKDGWVDLLRGNPGPFLYMKDARGVWYDSYSKSPNPQISIEDSGPLRASVCIKGYHSSGDSRRFCPYILRIHAFAGEKELHIFHTFIFDQDSDKMKLSEIGMKFPLRLGKNLRVAFGGG